MEYQTVISRKTPKIRRPVEKKRYTLASSLKKKPIELSKSRRFTIGRSSKNSLVLKEGTISERHASIKWEKSAFKIRDERSTNGTYVNNKRITAVTSLKDGDRIRFGKFVLRYGVKKVREKVADRPAKKKGAAKKGKVVAKKGKKRPAAGRAQKRSASRRRR